MRTKDYKKISNKILKWYQINKRDLPWRNTNNPYKIWVSEIMLQQTQVNRVVEYYEHFLKKFPKIEDVAKANWEYFLPVWRGLGFYSRGRNMIKTGKIITEEYGGKFPESVVELQKLPGIGPYTAAAIISFAHKEAIPAIDTNLTRVFQRVFGCTEKGVTPRATSFFEGADKNGYLLNHALMDLGSRICKGRKVNCSICPLEDDCHFLQSGTKKEWEKTLAKGNIGKKIVSKKIPMEVAVACIHKDGKYLIAKCPKEKGGNWEFPGGKREKGEDWRHCVKREIQEELGVEISARPHFFEETWEEGDYFWRLRFSRCQILRGIPKPHEHQELRWVTPAELIEYDFPSANMKALKQLKKMRMM